MIQIMQLSELLYTLKNKQLITQETLEKLINEPYMSEVRLRLENSGPFVTLSLPFDLEDYLKYHELQDPLIYKVYFDEYSYFYLLVLQ